MPVRVPRVEVSFAGTKKRPFGFRWRVAGLLRALGQWPAKLGIPSWHKVFKPRCAIIVER
jgi:hypothetical protein